MAPPAPAPPRPFFRCGASSPRLPPAPSGAGGRGGRRPHSLFAPRHLLTPGALSRARRRARAASLTNTRARVVEARFCAARPRARARRSSVPPRRPKRSPASPAPFSRAQRRGSHVRCRKTRLVPLFLGFRIDGAAAAFRRARAHAPPTPPALLPPAHRRRLRARTRVHDLTNSRCARACAGCGALRARSPLPPPPSPPARFLSPPTPDALDPTKKRRAFWPVQPSGNHGLAAHKRNTGGGAFGR